MRIDLSFINDGPLDTSRQVRGPDNISLYNTFSGDVEGGVLFETPFNLLNKERSLMIENGGAGEIRLTFIDSFAATLLTLDIQPQQSLLFAAPTGTVLLRVQNGASLPAPVNLLIF